MHLVRVTDEMVKKAQVTDAQRKEALAAMLKFSYILLPDSREVDQQYKIGSWPTSMVIDKAGIVKMISGSGPKVREELDAILDALKRRN